MPVLAHEEQVARLIDRHHDDGAAVLNDLVAGLTAVGRTQVDPDGS